MTRAEPCTPVQRIVFVKTHKTGSTTAVSIIDRYGYKRNLSFALPRYNHIMSTAGLFQRSMLKQSPPPVNGSRHYDILTNHVRYNRPEMTVVIPNATYLTILRHPVHQFESSFGYFEWDKEMKKINRKGDASINSFMENPQKYIDNKIKYSWQIHNGQLFDLGMSTQDTTNDSKVDAKIQSLDKEFDFVIIAEYFDESLLVLKMQLCWELDDILYISNNIRSPNRRSNISEDTYNKIMTWNKSDFKLYKHFNATLWKKINDYGPHFARDLRELKELNKEIMKSCINPNETYNRDHREMRYMLRPDAPKNCTDLWQGDVGFVNLLKAKQNKQLKKSPI
ncbi:galactosylceramide sulfotransferase-like [Glandiceps talaboti]